MTVLSLLLAIFKAIPSLKSWWDEIVSAYIAQEIINMKKELSSAIQKAANGDQRNTETYMGSPRAGLPSGEPGSIIVPSLPGVRKAD